MIKFTSLLLVLLVLIGCEAELSREDRAEIISLKEEVVALREELVESKALTIKERTSEVNGHKGLYIPPKVYRTQKDRLLDEIVINSGWRYIDVRPLGKNNYNVRFVSSYNGSLVEKEIEIPMETLRKVSRLNGYRAEIMFIVNQEERVNERDFVLALYNEIMSES